MPHELSLSMRPEQRMLLMPRMLQALEVLQLPRLAVDDLVATALAENEALTVARESSEELRRRRRDERRPRASAGEWHDAALQQAPARREPLREHLREQLAGIEAPARVTALLRALVESVDAAGFRTVDDGELAHAVDPPATAEEIARCEACVRTLDPPGVGARGAVDAMLRQIDPGDPDAPRLAACLQDHLDDLARNKRPAVARALGVTLEELEQLLARLARLSTRPGAAFDDGAASPVRPDLAVRRTADGFELAVEDAETVALAIDPRVAAAARDRSNPPEVRAHLRERLEAARAVLASLEQRRATLTRVARAVFASQREFLERGPRAIRPMRMQDVAESIGVHPSTVSRSVADKWVETEWGCVRLRDFFGVPVELASGETGSRENVKEAIRATFASEDRARPLGDEEVVTLLQARGFQLARRTVAKYRAELGIPSSWRRREHVSAQASA